MISKNAKQIVYRYNGDEKTEEVEEDLDGEVPVPDKGSRLNRKGKAWTVVHVLTELRGAAVPVVRIFLKDAGG